MRIRKKTVIGQLRIQSILRMIVDMKRGKLKAFKVSPLTKHRILLFIRKKISPAQKKSSKT